MTAGEKVHVYVVLDPVHTPTPGLEQVEHTPMIEHGDVFPSPERYGPGELISVADGPGLTQFVPGYLGSWGLGDDGQPALPATTERIMELFMLGSEGEKRLRAQLHTAFDLVKEHAESLKIDDDVRYELFAKMDRIEKTLQ